MMYDEMVIMFYTKWCESEDYKEQSSLENDVYDRYIRKIKAVIGEDEYYNVSDYVTSLACESEYAGFEAGLKYGILFVQGMQKGGVV